MKINEQTVLNAQIAVKDSNNVDVPIINLYANLDSANMNINTTVTTIDKDKASDSANATTIQEQYSSFISSVQAKAKELGFTIFA